MLISTIFGCSAASAARQSNSQLAQIHKTRRGETVIIISLGVGFVGPLPPE